MNKGTSSNNPFWKAY